MQDKVSKKVWDSANLSDYALMAWSMANDRVGREGALSVSDIMSMFPSINHYRAQQVQQHMTICGYLEKRHNGRFYRVPRPEILVMVYARLLADNSNKEIPF